jgi:hypothetical protein
MMNSLLFFFLSFFLFFAEASEISRIKGKNATITMSNESFSVGDTVFATDDSGKKTATLKIIKVKGDKAQAKVQKGQARQGMSVVSQGGEDSRSPSSKRRSSSRSSRGGSSRGKGKKSSYKKMGILGGIVQSSMSIDDGSTANQYAGSSFTVSGFMDIPLTSSLVMRGKLGYYPFTVKKGAEGVSFGYLGGEGGVNLYLSRSFWVGAGGAFLMTMSRNSNIPRFDTKASTNSFIFLGLGLNLSLGKNIIPISLDYAMYPGGSGVKSPSSLLIRAGYAWNF